MGVLELGLGAVNGGGGLVREENIWRIIKREREGGKGGKGKEG